VDAETEGAELEVLIGLSAQICKAIPEDFARELENGHHGRRQGYAPVCHGIPII